MMTKERVEKELANAADGLEDYEFVGLMHLCEDALRTCLALYEREERLEKELEIYRANDHCMCGARMDAHDIGSGHSPVSMYEHRLDQAEQRVERLREALFSTRSSMRRIYHELAQELGYKPGKRARAALKETAQMSDKPSSASP